MTEAALRAVPEGSWTARNLRAALDVAARTPRPLLGRALHDTVVVAHYPWTDLAPEAVALAFAAYAAGGGEVEASVVTAANLGRDADTTAAVAGALAGAGRARRRCPRAGPSASARWRAGACRWSPDGTSATSPTRS
ncbi:ADP-ribosylglycohydrolase family protein [Microbispora sp. GKU 823]|uniref:ADP-ribosylglycohydrolase family protein n=1 Tax=Microbispora sp. GKU 823 TaxID=1652100 RepID=UPI0026968F45